MNGCRDVRSRRDAQARLRAWSSGATPQCARKPFSKTADCDRAWYISAPALSDCSYNRYIHQVRLYPTAHAGEFPEEEAWVETVHELVAKSIKALRKDWMEQEENV
jgi:hypothetical protein